MLAALVLVAAPTSASAASGEDESAVEAEAAEATARELSRRGEFIAAGRAWAAIAASSEEPQERAVAAFRGYQAAVSAYEAEGDVGSLCLGYRLVADLAVDPEVDMPIQVDAHTRLEELDRLLLDRDLAGACEPDPELELGARPPQDAGPAAGIVLLPVRASDAGASSRSRVRADASDQPPTSEQVRRFRIAGVFVLSTSAAFLGAMTYGLVVDARAAAELREYRNKAEYELLTAADWWRIEGLRESGSSATQLATLTGIAGGLALVSGVALLLAGRRLDRRDRGAMASVPGVGFGVGKGHAALTLRGRF